MIHIIIFVFFFLYTTTLSNQQQQQQLILSNTKQYKLIKYNTNNNITQNKTIKYQCEHQMTFNEMKKLLGQHSCILIKDIMIHEHNNTSQRRSKRWGDNTANKINAIHGTINEQRNMINFLFNNSINATILNNAIYDHHTKSAPYFSSWRDLIDIILVTLVILYIIYLLIFRANFRPCNNCLLYLFQSFTRRVNEQENSKQKKETTTDQQLQKQLEELSKQIQQIQKNEQMKMRHTTQRNINTCRSVPSISSDIIRYNNYNDMF